MDELEPLATALRNELGPPPDDWQREQRIRLKQVLREPPRRRTAFRFAPAAAVALAAAAVLVWFVARPANSSDIERWLVAEELGKPYRFEDGSSISLGSEGRGRLQATSTAVRFDLHRGRAVFDVVPGRQRPWTITAGKNEVRVVGTRFSVSYGPAEAFEVNVERGVVSVKVPDRKASVELQAGDRLRGSPGRMEVAHDVSRERPPAPVLGNERNDEPPTPASESSVARAEPAPSAAPAMEWQARYRSGKYAESLALLRASGLSKRLDELPPATLADVADAARLGGDLELAARALGVLLKRFPRAPEARDGKFLLGRVHALRGDGPAAVAAFERYLAPGGSTQYASEAMGRLMELYSKRGDTEQARAMARRYLERAPTGPYRRLARSLVAEVE